MTAMALWATSDTKPRFQSHSSNLIDEDLAARGEWDLAIEKLQDWASDPSALEDEGISAPTAETLLLAKQLAVEGRDLGMPPPTRVMPNGEAGVVLEWVKESVRTFWEIDSDHWFEKSRFDGGRCVSRVRFDLSGLSQ